MSIKRSLRIPLPYLISNQLITKDNISTISTMLPNPMIYKGLATNGLKGYEQSYPQESNPCERSLSYSMLPLVD
jgi:hypothetical protein